MNSKMVKRGMNGKTNRYCSRQVHVWLVLGIVLLTMPLVAKTLVYVDYQGLESYTDRPDPIIDNILVIDPDTQKVVQRIKGITTAYTIDFSPDKKRIYVCSESESVLFVVDQKTGKVIKKVPLSGSPNTFVVTKDGGRVIVGIRQAPGPVDIQLRSRTGALDVIDTTRLERVRSIPMKGGLHDIYLTPDGKYVVAGSGEAHTVTVVDVQTEQPVWQVNVGSYVNNSAIEANPDGSTRRIFVTRHGLRGFDVVDFAERKLVAEIKLPETEASRGSWKDGPATQEEVQAIVGKKVAQDHGTGVSPDNKTFWINNELDHAVYVYSLPDLTLLGHVSIGKRPNWLAFSPDGKQVYDLNTNDDTLSIIDVRSMKEVARMQLERHPGHRVFKVSAVEIP